MSRQKYQTKGSLGNTSYRANCEGRKASRSEQLFQMRSRLQEDKQVTCAHND